MVRLKDLEISKYILENMPLEQWITANTLQRYYEDILNKSINSKTMRVHLQELAKEGVIEVREVNQRYVSYEYRRVK